MNKNQHPNAAEALLNWTLTRADGRIVVQHSSGAFYAAAKEGDGIAESILYMLADSLLSATLSPAHIEDEREACERWIRQRSGMPAHIPMDWDIPFNSYTWAAWSARAALSAPPATDPWTPSGADYDRNIHHNPDAKAWADLFVATFPGLADKHGLMIGWFANAMMAMHDWLKSKEEAAPPAAGVPEGWKLVPIEPTDAMLEIGAQCVYEPTGKEDIGDVWSNMLIEAPTPPASEQQRAVVMPELHDLNHHERYRAGWNSCVSEFLRLNPHLAKGEGV